jgi:hypothetical protein
MSMSARDRQALSTIENELGESDPWLADLLDEFSRRTAGAAMPAVERIRGKWLRGLARQRMLWRRGKRLRGRTRQRPRQRSLRRRVKWLPGVLVLWLLLVSAVVVVVLAAFNGGISSECPALAASHCAAQPLLRR